MTSDTSMDAGIDTLAHYARRIRAAAAEGRSLRLRGGGSKDFYGNDFHANAPAGSVQQEVLDTRHWHGILAYEPSELVITARAGTPLALLQQTLAEAGQYLPCESPLFGTGVSGAASVTVSGAAATLGGMVAAGLSGPGRMAAGAVRDFVLGATLMDGQGEIKRFGGTVMKNVAGYDVARALTGSMGTLGLLLDVSIKTLPLAPAEATLCFELDQPRMIEQLNRWSAQPLPLSASLWQSTQGAGVLHLRLRGAQAAVAAACQRLGGERLDDSAARQLWDDVREQRHAWFQPQAMSQQPCAEDLWRIAVPSTTPVLELDAPTLIEWAGALRWLRVPVRSVAERAAQAALIRAAAERAGGHATLFRRASLPAQGLAEHAEPEAFHPLKPAMMALQQRLKHAFDPHAVFNRGRLYRAF
jgi:glycolate oxidase FAD binding subunit